MIWKSFQKSKLIMFLLFVFTFTSVWGTEKAELTISIIDCRDSKNFAYLSELRILKNGEEFITLNPRDDSKQVLRDLELGNYILEYKSFFGKEESLKIELTQFKKYSIDLCLDFIDYSKETYTPFFDQLKDNEYYIVNIKSQGCFSSSEDSFTVLKNKELYTIIWDGRIKNLTTKEIDFLRRFEIELNHMNNNICSTTVSYVINYNGVTKDFEDGSCLWIGKHYLKSKIFED